MTDFAAITGYVGSHAWQGAALTITLINVVLGIANLRWQALSRRRLRRAMELEGRHSAGPVTAAVGDFVSQPAPKTEERTVFTAR